MQLAAPHALAAAVPPDPVRIAVFDFELEDASAGAAVAGDASADDDSMKAVSATVRQEIVVRRITRTEYVVAFQVRDAKTGAMLASRQSDLRMGANYSWSRGAAGLIRAGLLETSH